MRIRNKVLQIMRQAGDETLLYTLKMDITFGNGSFIPNFLRQVFHFQIKTKCESHSNIEDKFQM